MLYSAIHRFFLTLKKKHLHTAKQTVCFSFKSTGVCIHICIYVNNTYLFKREFFFNVKGFPALTG